MIREKGVGMEMRLPMGFYMALGFLITIDWILLAISMGIMAYRNRTGRGFLPVVFGGGGIMILLLLVGNRVLYRLLWRILEMDVVAVVGGLLHVAEFAVLAVVIGAGIYVIIKRKFRMMPALWVCSLLAFLFYVSFSLVLDVALLAQMNAAYYAVQKMRYLAIPLFIPALLSVIAAAMSKEESS
jgi:hypothetical protein